MAASVPTATVLAASVLAASVLAASILAAATPTLVHAADIEEVVVTARKIPETRARMPLALDVIKAELTGPGGIDSLHDLAARVPGLIHESRQGGGQTATALRGQQQSTTFNNDTVGVFVDGVFQANKEVVNVDLLDVARIEVVRGPQGTLFGHSTFAGAVHYVSAAPTENLEAGFRIDAGTDALIGMQGVVSGPVAGPLLARAALGYSSESGTLDNTQPGGGTLGDNMRKSASLALATDASLPWSAELRLRYSRVTAGTSAYDTLTFQDFNCGSRVSGAWSYFCGEVPESAPIQLPTALDDSRSRTRQAVLRFDWPLDDQAVDRGLPGHWRVISESSFYAAQATVLRDSSGGDGVLMGVCNITSTCNGGLVSRLERRQLIDEFETTVHELGQEVRLEGDVGETIDVMLGVFGWRNRFDFLTRAGVARGVLSADERLTGFLPAVPLAVGPVLAINRALVNDPFDERVPRNGFLEKRSSWGAFTALTWTPWPTLHLRGELRASRERVRLDSRHDSFRPGFGEAIKPVTFDRLLPRWSVDWLAGEHTVLYASLARGARSGGINAQAGLIEAEQQYDEETNWTSELGLRYAGAGKWRSLSLTAFHIDWQDTQINAFPDSPGVLALIVANTAGVKTSGIEAGFVVAPFDWLTLEGAWTRIESRFNSGSDSPGDSAACGLSARNGVSSFCTTGAPRIRAAGATPFVAWIDDGPLPRVPSRPWHLGIVLSPETSFAGWTAQLRADINHRDDMYERPIKGLVIGGRTLLDLGLSLKRDAWHAQLWIRNLTDEEYVQTTATGVPLYFPSTPRPIYLFRGERRRAGFTLHYQTGG